jgi:hypothetical protein
MITKPEWKPEAVPAGHRPCRKAIAILSGFQKRALAFHEETPRSLLFRLAAMYAVKFP